MAGGDGLGIPCILLMVIAGLERFVFKGVSSNLVTYLTDVMKMSNSSAAKIVNSWCGFSFIMPIVVSPFTACFWDHYSTILTFSLLYVVGLVALTSTAIDWPWSPKASKSTTAAASLPILLSSLFIISFAQGGYNPSLQVLGADHQFQEQEKEEEEEEDFPSCKKTTSNTRKKSLFFTWWYFGICSGSLLGLSILPYIQDTISWGLGFGIPAVVMVCSVVLISTGSRFYIHTPPSRVADRHRTLEIRWSRFLKATLSKMLNHRSSREDSRAQDIELEKLQEKPLCCMDSKQEMEETSRRSSRPIFPTENLKTVLRLLPIWAMLLVFAIIFQQPPTFFTKQGTAMTRNIAGSNFMIPPATLQGAINVSVVFMLPLYDKIVVPITRMITRNEKGMTVMQRMGSGMFLSTLAMIIAALVEEQRLRISAKMDYASPDATNATVPLSIFWLLPQYMLLGFSDIFTVVGMNEFFYGEVPMTMRTVGIALGTSVFGVGSFLSALMISVIENVTSCGGKKPSWFSDDMGQARLDKFYWLLAGGSGISLFIYVILCKFFKSINDDLNNSQKQ